jgi:CRP-like cAMP-binding protein
VFVLQPATVTAREVVELVLLPREEVLNMVEEGRPMIRG